MKKKGDKNYIFEMKTSINPTLDDITSIEINQTLFIESLKNIKRNEDGPIKEKEFIFPDV